MEYFDFLIQMDEINRGIEAQPQVDCCNLTPAEREEAMSQLRELEERQRQILIRFGILKETAPDFGR